MTSLESSVPSPESHSTVPSAACRPSAVLGAQSSSGHSQGAGFCRHLLPFLLGTAPPRIEGGGGSSGPLWGGLGGEVLGAGQALVPVCCPRPQVKRNSTPPLSLFGQLLWREFFYTAATNNPRFDRMEGNPICIQIPWDRNPEALAKWAEGKTGFPWIDAIMTQLRQEGWIHHLARHAVACFLTRGDLWVSWESGVRVSALSVGSPHGG